MNGPALVVSLHDVSPRTQKPCTEILEQLRALGVPRCSLLVIPDHHHGGHFLQDPGFCQWLCERSRQGHEVVIHGYYHQRQRQPRESLLQKLTTRIYTADEGEWFDLGKQDAQSLYRRAQEDFAQLGLAPKGFIAPAWLLSAPAEEALRESGCTYTTRLGSISDFVSNRVFASQSLVWSVRSAWRRGASRVWNQWLFQRLSSHGLIRISLHPVDVGHEGIWRQIRALVTESIAKRAPMTYEDWLTGQSV